MNEMNKTTLPTEESPVVRKDVKEFQQSGLLAFINHILHAFGWAIVVTSDGTMYPARVLFRGFSEDSQTQMYQRLSHYMKENADDLIRESES